RVCVVFRFVTVVLVLVLYVFSYHSSLCVFFFFFSLSCDLRDLYSFPTRRSSDLFFRVLRDQKEALVEAIGLTPFSREEFSISCRSEEHTSELQSRSDLVCRLLLEKKKITKTSPISRRHNTQTTTNPLIRCRSSPH